MHKGMSPINRKAKLNILINRFKMDVPSTCTHKNSHAYKSQDGFCSLYCACQGGYCGIVEILLKTGATVDLQNKVEG